MSDISPVNRPSLASLGQSYRLNPREAVPASAPARQADQAEFSTVSRLRSLLSDLPIREDLVNRVRAEIADGTYDSDEKINATIDRLAEDVSLGSTEPAAAYKA